MNSQKQEYTSIKDYLARRAVHTAHINTENIESISYEDENTGNVSDLTTYLHKSVRDILYKMDEQINASIAKSSLQPF